MHDKSTNIKFNLATLQCDLLKITLPLVPANILLSAKVKSEHTYASNATVEYGVSIDGTLSLSSFL